MKKIFLIIMFSFLLLGCVPEKEIETKNKTIASSNEKNESFEIFKNEYVVLEIQRLQKQIDSGEITEEAAAEALKENIIQLKNSEDNSIKSILAKVRLMDELLAENLEKRIKKNHPELFQKEGL